MADSHNEKSSTPAMPEVVKNFLANMKLETEVRKQAEDNRKQTIKYNYELAKQSLNAQAEDRRENREHQKVLLRWLMQFSAFVIVVIAVVFCVALFLNKEAFLLEIIKAIAYCTVGFFARGAFRKTKKPDSDETQE